MIDQVKFLWCHITQKKRLGILAVWIFLVGACSAVYSFGMGNALQSAASFYLQDIWQVFGSLMLLSLMRGFMQWQSDVYSEKLLIAMEQTFHNAILGSLLTSDFDKLNKKQTGDLLNRVQSTLNNMPLLLKLLVNLVASGGVILILLGALCLISWKVLVAYLAILPIYLWVQKKMINATKAFNPYVDARAALDAQTLDILTHRTTVKVYQLESYFLKKISSSLDSVDMS